LAGLHLHDVRSGMKYVDEFRDGALAKNIATNIAREIDPQRRYHLMEFCGGHTHAISRYGIADLLPANGWKMPSSWRKHRA
jgi:hydrogenase expression/formation protein HypD